MKAFKACLTLAANDDERITNRRAWKLPALRDTANPRNVILTEPQVRDVVAASYADGRLSLRRLHRDAGGDRREAGSGAAAHGRRSRSRSSRRPAPPDAKLEEGRGKKRIERAPLPIPAGLAKRLKAEAVGRADDEPLLRDNEAPSWTETEHQPTVRERRRRGEVCRRTRRRTALRHSFITRSLLKGIPVRLVAASVDSSTAMIEATYSKFITRPGADLMRGALIDFDAPAPRDVNVVPLRGKAS